jgi:hypothetical protein
MLNNYELIKWAIGILVVLTVAMDIHSYHLQRDLDIRSKNIEQDLLYIEYELKRIEQVIKSK